MEFKDRVANKPNRVKLTYEDSGASSYATVELADEPIEEGTPLNKKTFDDLKKELNAYIVGNVLITSTYENPSEYLGGRWELIDKEFRDEAGGFEIDNDDLNFGSSFSPYVYDKAYAQYVRGGHTVQIRLQLQLKRGYTWDDSGVSESAHLNFPDFGFYSLPMDIIHVPCYTDGIAPSGLLMGVNYEGWIRQYDVLNSSHSLTINTTGDSLNFNFSVITTAGNMVNDFCDKFYWKRIG